MTILGMSAGDTVATYAAIVATFSLLWQVYLWISRRRTNVEVVLSDDSTVTMGIPNRTVQLVCVTAINRSEHAIRVVQAGLESSDGSTIKAPEAAHPGVIEPHDSGQVTLNQDQVKKHGINLSKPVTGWVRLATNELVRSKPFALLRPE